MGTPEWARCKQAFPPNTAVLVLFGRSLVLLFPVAKFRQKEKLRIKISPKKVIFEAFSRQK
jgi:hypothetical protein